MWRFARRRLNGHHKSAERAGRGPLTGKAQNDFPQHGGHPALKLSWIRALGGRQKRVRTCESELRSEFGACPLKTIIESPSSFCAEGAIHPEDREPDFAAGYTQWISATMAVAMNVEVTRLSGPDGYQREMDSRPLSTPSLNDHGKPGSR